MLLQLLRHLPGRRTKAPDMEGVQQLESHPYAAQLRARIRRQSGVDHRAGGKDVAGLVVVGHQHLQAQLQGERHFFRIVHAAIDRDQQVRTLGRDGLHGRGREAVPLNEAVGQEGPHGQAQIAETADHERGGGYAVHIVVAVDYHVGRAVDGMTEHVHRGLHVMQQERVRHVRVHIQELASRIHGTEAATNQDHPHHQGHVQLSGDAFGQGPVERCDLPGEGIHYEKQYTPTLGQTESGADDASGTTFRVDHILPERMIAHISQTPKTKGDAEPDNAQDRDAEQLDRRPGRTQP